ncbi:hypothetical protein [Leptospira santarosai]|uniref:hypothetical protein n=1 Tax=Leptospira santarosai TaxID=28183 RepID=UPI0024AEA596|nr:hypothetical protein [Leptospira santarosai]MDI7211612.1 hypothetical protein [Leptospira santarosai]
MMSNKNHDDLEHLIARMYQLYNRADDQGVYDILKRIRELTPEFQPEPKIILVERIITQPWNNQALKLCQEAEKAIQEKRFIRGLNQSQKALQISPFFSMAYLRIGLSYLLQKDLENAFLNLQKALALDRKYSEAFYNLSRVHALRENETEMLDYLEKAIVWSEKWQDYASKSLNDEHFRVYWKELNQIHDRFPIEPNLRKLYKYLQDHWFYEAFCLGKELFLIETDQLAVIEVMISSTKGIIRDLNEHEENVSIYNDQPLSFWKNKAIELENDRKILIDSGKKSDVFSRFSAKPARNPEKLFIVSNELAEEILNGNNK